HGYVVCFTHFVHMLKLLLNRADAPWCAGRRRGIYNAGICLHPIAEGFEIRGVIEQHSVLDIYQLCWVKPFVSIPHIIQLTIEDKHARNEYKCDNELKGQ